MTTINRPSCEPSIDQRHRLMGSSPSGTISPERLIDLARQAGAEAAEVFQSQSCSRPVFFEANRLKQLESTQSAGTALRLWLQGRPGLAVAYGSVDPQVLVDRALALSQLSDPETIELGDASTLVYPDLGRAVTTEQLMDWGREAIARIRDHHPDVLCSAEWECDIETTRLVNSYGLDCGYSDTTLGCFVSAEWIRGDDFLNVSDGQTRRNRLDPLAVVEQILQRLDWATENAPLPSRRMPVLFTAKAADMLWGTIQAALNSKQVLEGASPWSGRDTTSPQTRIETSRMGDRVMSDLLTLAQQPAIGPFSCPFDDEGVPTQTLTFIEAGVLRGFYSDRKTARLLGQTTTGNGFRPGLGSYPAPGLFNFVITPGHGSLLDLIQAMGDGLVVDQMLGGGAGISGDFTINVDLGYRVRNGEIVGRVKDTMVAGNVYAALKQVMHLGADVDWNGSCHTPSIIVDGLSVNGRID